MRGDRLRELRLRAGLTQKDLADRIFTTQTNIKRWENNTVVPSSESVVRIAQHFNVTSDYILGLVDDPQAQISSTDLTSSEQRLILLSRSGKLAEAMQALAGLHQEVGDKE